MKHPLPRFQITRDLFMFMLGAGAFVYEVLHGGDRANILYLSGALMGVAAYLRAIAAAERSDDDDEKKRRS